MLIVFIINGNNEALFRQKGGENLRMEMEAVFLEAQTYNLCSFVRRPSDWQNPVLPLLGLGLKDLWHLGSPSNYALAATLTAL